MINLFLKDCSTLFTPQGVQRSNFEFDISDYFDEGGVFDDSYNSGSIDFLDDCDFYESLSSMVSSLEDISLYSSYSSYSGVIPEPYISYFSDIFASPDHFFDDYVAFVTQEYSGSYSSTVYNMFVSDNLLYNGSSFSGSGTIYKYYSSSRFPTFEHYSDSNFSFTPGSGAVFTSLSSPYPDFTVTSLSSVRILYALFFAFLIFSFHFMFHVKHSQRR